MSIFTPSKYVTKASVRVCSEMSGGFHTFASNFALALAATH